MAAAQNSAAVLQAALAGRHFLVQADDVMRQEKSCLRQAEFRLGHGACLTGRRSRLDSLAAVAADDHARTAAIPFGTVEFCRRWMQLCGITEPAPLSYPEDLRDMLAAPVTACSWGDVATGDFAKPRCRIKAWTGHVRGAPPAQEAALVATLADDEPVWRAPAVAMVSEVRAYVWRGRLVGTARYDDGTDQAALPDPAVIAAAVRRFGERVAGAALDFAMTDTGRTVLVEVNDGWALGYYPWGDCPAEAYLTLLAQRWAEIATVGTGGRG